MCVAADTFTPEAAATVRLDELVYCNGNKHRVFLYTSVISWTFP